MIEERIDELIIVYQEIHRMEYFMNELKLIKKEIENERH